MSQVALAFLWFDDGRIRQVCIGCTMRLVELGMVRLVKAKPLNDRQPEFTTCLYEIVPPHTLESCRTAITDRHVGAAWGS